MRYSKFTPEEFKQLFKIIGAEYVGMQQFTPKDTKLVLFNDLLTGSTLALPIAELSIERIMTHMYDSRKKFEDAKKK